MEYFPCYSLYAATDVPNNICLYLNLYWFNKFNKTEEIGFAHETKDELGLG